MDLRAGADLDIDELVRLYESVGWTAYAGAPDTLLSALSGSHVVVSAWRDRRLVGLSRTISDGVTICYVQDLLVHPDAQRRGVGRALLGDLLERYRGCRQFVLSTDADTPGVHAFYRSMGLVPHVEAGMTAFIRARS